MRSLLKRLFINRDFGLLFMGRVVSQVRGRHELLCHDLARP